MEVDLTMVRRGVSMTTCQLPCVRCFRYVRCGDVLTAWSHSAGVMGSVGRYGRESEGIGTMLNKETLLYIR